MTTIPATPLSDLEATAKEALTFLQRSAQAGVSIMRNMRTQHAEIGARWDLPEAQKATGQSQAREAARRELTELQFQVRDAERAIDEYVTRASSAQHVDSDAAAESRRAAGWARMRDRLDASGSAYERAAAARGIIEEAAAADDQGLLQGARRELSNYLTARGAELPPVIARDLDVLAGPPEATAARAFEDQHSRGIYRTKVAVNTLVAGFDSRNVGVVPGWDEGSTILIDEPEAT